MTNDHVDESYQHLSVGALQSLLENYIKNLTHLEHQRAGYGSVDVPLHIINQIQQTQRIIRVIKSEIQGQQTTQRPIVQNPIAYRYQPDYDPNSSHAHYNLFYIANILDRSIEELVPFRELPFEQTIPAIGSSPALPQSGEIRTYHLDDFLISLNITRNGIVRGMTIEELSRENYPLDDWHGILHRLGISMRQHPDVRDIMAYRWKNYQGYAIVVAAAKVGGPINSVQVYKVS